MKTLVSSRIPRRSFGFSLIELLVVVAVMLTIAALAIPNLLRSRMLANESSAVAAMRSITTAEVGYETTYQRGYAPGLPALGPPAPGNQASVNAADLIDVTVASGLKAGYIFFYAAADTNGDGKNDRYTINANPITPGSTGIRYFFVDQTNVIRFSTTGPATSASPPIPM